MKVGNIALILVLASFLSINLMAQESEQGVLIMRGAVDEDFDPLSNVNVTLYHNNSEVNSVSTSSDGSFELQMELNKEYTIEFSKKDYVTKKIFVDASVPGDASGNWAVEFPIGMFKMYPGLDVSALENPVTKIIYIEDEGGFGYDRLYTEKMMAKIDKIMRQLEQLKEEAYRNIIRTGDRHFDQKEYREAIAYYEKALDQRPKDRYPKKRLEDAQEMLKEKKERRELYEKAITKADQLFQQEQYKEAKTTYYEAINYDPQEQYPHDQISKIDDILTQQRLQKQQREEQLAEYNEYIKQGDKQFASKSYDMAKLSYQNALGLFPDKSYPKEQLNKISQLISEMEAQQAINANYNQIIQKADEQFNQGNLTLAKASYLEAQNVKSSEIYPKQQVEKINELLAEQKASEQKYAELIQSAEQAFSTEQYNEAKSDYQAALKIKPNELYPEAQIQKINSILEKHEKQLAEYNNLINQANQAFNQESYTQAKSLYSEALFVKPDEQYPNNQINKIDDILSSQQTLNQNYQSAIESGDQYFNEEKYTMAKGSYNKALEFKPGKTYPKQKIEEINSLLTQQEQRKQQYKSLIAQADKAFENKEYTASKNSYQAALEINPNQAYPKNQVDKINQLLTDLEKQKQQGQQYNSMIEKADIAFNQENYTESKAFYSEALFIKPDEQYPKDQIDKIDALLAQRRKEEASRKAALEKYNNAIEKADGMFQMEEYTQAMQFYNDALTIKPDEQYPKQRVREIESILQKRRAEEQAYREAISKADELFNAEAYKEAKSFYNNALEIRSSEQYPRSQINKIDEILASRLAERKRQEQINKRYNDAIGTADQLFNAEQYEDSKIAYNEASKIKPEESYPKEQIQKINNILEERRLALDRSYNNAIQQGDDQFRNERYEEARERYEEALGYKPNETYPKSQISKIEEIMASLERQRKEKERAERLYAEAIEKGDELYKDHDYYNARTEYQKALQYKPNEEYPENRLELIKDILADLDKAKNENERQTARKEKEDKPKSKLQDFDEFKTKAEEKAYLNKLAKRYPNGVTVEHFNVDNRKIERIIVNYDGIATEYRKVRHSWGGTYFFRNGRSISNAVYKIETKERD